MIADKAAQAIHVLDRFHIMAHLSDAIDEVRAGKVRQMKVDGFEPPPESKKVNRGRPGMYGQSVLLINLLRSALAITTAQSPLYDDKNVQLRIRSIDLLWKHVGRQVRFVLVEHPPRGRWVLMGSDLSLEPIDIVRIYGLRFKLEFGFKQAAHVIGSFDYHFRMMDMNRSSRANGNQYQHRESDDNRQAGRRKLHTYHVICSRVSSHRA